MRVRRKSEGGAHSLRQDTDDIEAEARCRFAAGRQRAQAGEFLEQQRHIFGCDAGRALTTVLRGDIAVSARMNARLLARRFRGPTDARTSRPSWASKVPRSLNARPRSMSRDLHQPGPPSPRLS